MSLRPAILVLCSTGCWLERVTGEPVPLDPAYYESVEAAQGQPGVGGGGAVPFSDHYGDKITVSGIISGGDDQLSVDLDVRVPDPKSPGGVSAQGKMLIEAPGPFEIEVPVDLGALELHAFQDLSGDGPTGDDPFAGVNLEIGDEDVEDVTLAMESGGWSGGGGGGPGGGGPGGGGPVHTEMPVGSPGGDPSVGAPGPGEPGEPGPGEPGVPPEMPPPGDGQPGEPTPGEPVAPPPGGGLGDPFVNHTGPKVTLRGQLLWGGDESIDLDLFQPDLNSPGGRRPVGKLKLPAGPFSLDVPQHFGPLGLEAFIDLDGNGPDAGDPRGCYPGGAVNVGENDLRGLNIGLEVSTDGAPSTCSPKAPEVRPGAPPQRR